MARKAKVFIILILFLSALFFWPTLMDKYQVSRYLLQSAILIIAGFMFYGNFQKQRSASLNLIDIAFLSYYLIHLFSTFWAYNLGEAVFTTQKILIGFTIYYFTRLLLVRKNLDLIKIIGQTSNALTAVLLIYVSFEIIRTATENGLSNQALYNVSGAMGNKSLLSEFLLLLLPLNLIGTSGLWTKKWLISLIFFQIMVILILQVRTTYLVLFLCSGIYIFRGLLNSKRFRKSFIVKALPAGVGLMAFIYALIRFTGLFPDLADRLNISTWLFSTTVSERFFIWFKTLSLISDNWLFGLGSGNWKVFFPSNSIEGGWRFETLDTFATRVHNDYLEVFAETGLFGLLSFLAIFFFAFYAGIRKLRKNESPKSEKLFLVLLGLLAYALISLFDFPKERLEHQMIFSILLAICAYLCKDYLKLKAPQKPGKWFQLFFGLIMGLLATNFYSGALRFKGEFHVRKAINAKINQNWPLLIAESKKSESHLYSLDPTTTPIAWYEGIGYFHQNDMLSAHAAFERAYLHNPFNYQVLNNYGSTFVKQEKYQEAVPLFKEALRINPSFDECKFNLAFALYHLGQYEKALDWVYQTENEERKQVFIETIRAAYPEE